MTRVVVDGLTAANDLGLTTAVPGRVTVLTDARLRPIQLGRQQIRFQAAAPSRLYWAGHPAMRIVQALYWLHDLLDADRGNAMRRLRRSLGDPTHGPILRADLQQGIHTLPIWMQSTVRDLLRTRGGHRLARSPPGSQACPRGRAVLRRSAGSPMNPEYVRIIASRDDDRRALFAATPGASAPLSRTSRRTSGSVGHSRPCFTGFHRTVPACSSRAGRRSRRRSG